MWEGMERSPALAAPGSNDFGGLIASTTNKEIGANNRKLQALSEEDANDLCERYRPLAYKIASLYRDKGVDLEDLRAAGLVGLVLASRKFKPDREVPFGGYAQHWIRGEITNLFKRNNPLDRAKSLTLKNLTDEEFHQRDVADAPPVIAPDLSGLSERERLIVEARAAGKTLGEIGKGLGLSAERIRQIEALARPRIKGIAAAVCVADLTKRGDPRVIIRQPEQYARSGAALCDRPPPTHTYREPKPSREIVHHRANAIGLAGVRGGEPFRNERGPYGGPVIHTWGRS